MKTQLVTRTLSGVRFAYNFNPSAAFTVNEFDVVTSYGEDTEHFTVGMKSEDAENALIRAFRASKALKDHEGNVTVNGQDMTEDAEFEEMPTDVQASLNPAQKTIEFTQPTKKEIEEIPAPPNEQTVKEEDIPTVTKAEVPKAKKAVPPTINIAKESKPGPEPTDAYLKEFAEQLVTTFNNVEDRLSGFDEKLEENAQILRTAGVYKDFREFSDNALDAHMLVQYIYQSYKGRKGAIENAKKLLQKSSVKVHMPSLKVPNMDVINADVINFAAGISRDLYANIDTEYTGLKRAIEDAKGSDGDEPVAVAVPSPKPVKGGNANVQPKSTVAKEVATETPSKPKAASKPISKKGAKQQPAKSNPGTAKASKGSSTSSKKTTPSGGASAKKVVAKTPKTEKPVAKVGDAKPAVGTSYKGLREALANVFTPLEELGGFTLIQQAQSWSKALAGGGFAKGTPQIKAKGRLNHLVKTLQDMKELQKHLDALDAGKKVDAKATKKLITASGKAVSVANALIAKIKEVDEMMRKAKEVNAPAAKA